MINKTTYTVSKTVQHFIKDTRVFETKSRVILVARGNGNKAMQVREFSFFRQNNSAASSGCSSCVCALQRASEESEGGSWTLERRKSLLTITRKLAENGDLADLDENGFDFNCVIWSIKDR